MPQCHPTSWVAPTAVLCGAVTIEAEASIWYSAVLRADFDSISIGAGTNIQDGAVLHTDDGLHLEVGSGVTVGHGAILHGCRVEDEVLVGMGSIVMNGAVIGTGSLVAAGSLVPQGMKIPPQSLVRGSPARVARQTTEEEREHIRLSAAVYSERKKLHSGG